MAPLSCTLRVFFWLGKKSISNWLWMRVAALVDGHFVDGGAQVGAVIEVETAQVKLVGLAFAAMLADDQSRHRFEQFAGTVVGARFQLLLRDAAGIGRIGHAQLVHARAIDQHALEDIVGVGEYRAEEGGEQERQVAWRHYLIGSSVF